MTNLKTRKFEVMKNVIVLLLFTQMVLGQTLPKASQLSKINQVVGATELSLEYSRPNVNGRQIFGSLLPFNKLWRLGANGSTKITTTDTLFFDSGIIAPGTYAVFAIPLSKQKWAIIFNSDYKQRGTGTYESSKDILRMDVAANPNASFSESLSLTFDHIGYDSAEILIKWSSTEVRIPFKVNTNFNAEQNINEAIKKGENLGIVYLNAGSFYHFYMKDYDRANKYIDQSLDIIKTDKGYYIKSLLLAHEGKKKKAIKFAKKALKLAEENKKVGFVNKISKQINTWEKE